MKILLCDLDGTLLTDDKKITPGVEEAVRLWQEAGNLFVVATGRLIPSAQYFADMVDSGGLVVACSGAAIYKRGDMVYEKTVPLHIVEKLWQNLEDTDVFAQIYSDRNLIYNKKEGLFEGYKFHRKFNNQYRLPLIHMEKYDRSMIPGNVHKLSFVCHDHDKAKKIIAELGDLSKVNIFRSLPHLYDIISVEADKGIAGTWLKDILEADKVYAIGDNENDTAMLVDADYSAAMAISPKEVIEEADMVVASNEEDGVAEFIYYLLDKEEKKNPS